MTNEIDRRAFLELAALGSAGVAFGSALSGTVSAATRGDDFYFVQVSDTHWGYEGPANPDAKGTLPKAVAAINRLEHRPDFVMFTGDLTHTTDDPDQRRKRLREFLALAQELNVPALRFIPGEHDAALDYGAAFAELLGPPHYSFDHKGIHFVALDNVSDPRASLGEAQLAWLEQDLAARDVEAPIVVFAHRPLYDLAPEWDWATRDGAAALELLMPHRNVTVFYGHIHQTHHWMTGHISHHAASSLIFPLPPPKSQPKRTPVPWDPMNPYKGLGYRSVEIDADAAHYEIDELPISAAEPPR